MTNKTSLVIDCRMINMSGIGTYLKNILPRLIESEQFIITCMGYDNIKKFSWYDKINFIPLDSAILSLSEQFELPLKIPKCDIFWSPNWNIPLFFIKAKERIVTVHDVYHLANPSSFSKIYIAGIKIYMKFIDVYCKKIITVSEFSKNEIIKHTKIASKKINVINLAVNDKFDDFIPDFEINDSYLLYVGNVKPHKNLLLSLQAFKEIDDKEIKFFIVGKKDGFITNDNSLDEILKSLHSRVVFTGEISDNELKTYYKNAKFFLFPSKYEGFGLPILEAMKFSLPIISSSSASIPEVAGKCAIYFNAFNKDDLVNKINGFLLGEIKSNIESYSAQLQKFSWKQTVLKHIELFNELIYENSPNSKIL